MLCCKSGVNRGFGAFCLQPKNCYVEKKVRNQALPSRALAGRHECFDVLSSDGCAAPHPSPCFSLPLLPDGAETNSSKLLGLPLTEEPQQRLKWQAHLEFTHNHDVGDLTWDKIEVTLPRSDKLRSLVLAGIPHSMRPQVRVLPGWAQPPARSKRQRNETAFSWLRGCQVMALSGSSSPCSAVDAPFWGLAEEEEFRDVVSGYREKQL